MHRIICVIPAKKRSRRLKGKNSKLFFNKPLVFWTLNFAKSLKLVDKIVLTSDSQEILNIAKPFKKITGLMRDKKLARDNTLMWDVVKDVIDKYNPNYFDGILLLQPTTPYRSIVKFNNYLKYFKEKKQNYYSVSTTSKTNHPCYLKSKKLFFKKKREKVLSNRIINTVKHAEFFKKKIF